MNRFILFLILGSISEICFGQTHIQVNEGRILNDGRLPQITIIEGDVGGLCTGELVGPKIVLTAAHCCEGGVTDAKAFGGTLRWKIHPGYRKISSPYFGYALPDIYVLENDICILELKELISNITPFSLPNQPVITGEEHIIVGSGEPYPGVRQYGFVKATKMTEKGIQATGDINYGRPGDSGGPLLSGALGKPVQLQGIASVSTYFCGFDQGVIFTEDNKYRCAGMSSQVPTEIFVPARTTGFASLSNADNLAFLKNYAEDMKVDVCGINQTCNSVVFEQ